MYSQRIAEIETWQNRPPPIDCGKHARRSLDLSYFEQAVLYMKNNNDLECEIYVRKTTQGKWPSPILVLMHLGTQVIVTPVHTMLEATGKALHLLLWQHSWISQILILVSLITSIAGFILLIKYFLDQKRALELRHVKRRYMKDEKYEPYARRNIDFHSYDFDNRTYRQLYCDRNSNSSVPTIYKTTTESLNDNEGSDLCGIMIQEQE